MKYKVQIHKTPVQMQTWGFGLTFGGAQEMLAAGPQQAAESGCAGGDLLLQERTNSGADLQQVVCADVPVEFHLDAQTPALISAGGQETGGGGCPRHRKRSALGGRYVLFLFLFSLCLHRKKENKHF